MYRNDIFELRIYYDEIRKLFRIKVLIVNALSRNNQLFL